MHTISHSTLYKNDPWHTPSRPEVYTAASVSTSNEITPLPDKLLGRVPHECWCLILSFVPPAQLVLKTQVCSRWKQIIQHDLAVPLWKQLAIQCDLGEPKNLIKDYHQLVLGHVLLICELCLRKSKKGVGSAVPLPVVREDGFGKTWMCRPCRRRYFERRPEPTRESQPSDYEFQKGVGGHGATMWSICSAPVIVSPTEGDGSLWTSPIHASSLLSASSQQHEENRGVGHGPSTTVIPLDSPYCLEHAHEIGQGIVSEARYHHGGDAGIQAHCGAQAIYSLLRRRRRKLLSTLLGLVGLKLRSDSKLCGRYLRGSKDDPFRIVEIMREMEWYYEETSYIEYFDLDYDSADCKALALKDWIQNMVDESGSAQEAKEKYKELNEKIDSADVSDKAMCMVVNGELERLHHEAPPRSLWPLLDSWLDHWQHGDHEYRPPNSTFDVDCEAGDWSD
ncbi:hypothetical protein EDD21DRAFT_362192 [Dissophora ornata]|nr:hypothetical protein EDD21DRAFT_362192 [Dissophora ornata]